jgi:hypothetical protein
MSILYPIACAEDGTPVHIDAWSRGHDVSCFGCGERLIGRLPHDGIAPTAHFAHRSDASCSGETALHRAAKAAIVGAHGKHTLHSLVWSCPRCRRWPHRTDLGALELREEDRPCDGVTSDVLGRDRSGDPFLAIEIVVTHDVEPATMDRYRAQEIAVFSLRPSWGLVGDLVRGIDELRVDHRLGEVDSDVCAGCQQVLREKLEWAERERRRKEDAWWDAWLTTWMRVGSEEVRIVEDRLRASKRYQAREAVWWEAWSRMWPQIGDRIVSAWWSEWNSMWRKIGAEHVRPYVWWRAWRSMWKAIGDQYVVDERARERRSAAFWSTWIHMWNDIGKRHSGIMAVWRPICRSCRQDLVQGQEHNCP